MTAPAILIPFLFEWLDQALRAKLPKNNSKDHDLFNHVADTKFIAYYVSIIRLFAISNLYAALCCI